jgi:hypothetical protein
VKVTLLLLLLTACHNSSKTDAVTHRDAPLPAASTTSASVPAGSAAASNSWFVGAWQGAFRAELFRVQVPLGGMKEWKADDGQQASGDGTLSLQAATDGNVIGTSNGALGELSVVGHFEGDRATLMLQSPRPDGFHGVILASQTPEGLSGTLSASTGDSLQVRQAKVTLTRAGK